MENKGNGVFSHNVDPRIKDIFKNASPKVLGQIFTLIANAGVFVLSDAMFLLVAHKKELIFMHFFVFFYCECNKWY